MASPRTYPRTRYDMVHAAYKRLGTGKCKSCGKDIEWWLTTNKKKVPFNPGGEHDDAIVHRITCGTNLPSPTPEDISREVQSLCDRLNARVVTVALDYGNFFAYRSGISGEELRTDLIAVGNSVRNHIAKGDPDAFHS